MDATLPADEHTPVPPVLPRAATPSPNVVGDGRYELREEVGRGGLGRVMRAHDRRLDRQIAVKELAHASAEATRRFLREARITARLQHPSIVPVHDTGRLADGTPFYSMKLVAGRSLADVLRACTDMPARLALLPHVLAIAEAVAYAHSENVVHRDLKPQNVLIGQFGETTVIDWGLAKELGGADDDSLDDAPAPARTGEGHTVVGTVMGTPAFMPPEQARGETVDKRADVYAIGAILYAVLTGDAPYAGHSAAEILDRVQSTAPAPVILVEAQVPRDLAAIVDRAMARERGARYADAGALADDLKRFLTGQLVAAHGYSTWEIMRRWLGRHRAVVSVAAVLLVALAVTGIVSFRRVVASREDALRQQLLAERREVEADAARVEAEARSNQLMLMQAKHTVESDPTAALAWLARVASAGGKVDAAELQVTAAEAVAGGVALHVMHGHTVAVQQLRFAGDGTRLASFSDDGTVRLWDLRTGKTTGVIDGPRILDFDVAPDGRAIVVADESGVVRVHTIDGGDGVVVGRHTGAVIHVRYLPGSGRVCSAGADGAIHEWGDGGVAIRSYTLDGPVHGFAVSEAGDIAAATEHGDVQLWHDAASPPIKLARDEGGVRRLAFAPGTRYLAGSSDREVRLWALGARPRLEARVEGSFHALSFSPSGRWLVVASPTEVMRVDLDHPAAAPIPVSSREAQNPSWTPDSETLLLDGRNGVTLRRIDDDSSRYVPFPNMCSSLAVSPDSRLLVTGAYDGSIRVFDRSAIGVGRSYTLPAAGRALVALPGGLVAIAGLDGKLTFIDDAARGVTAIAASDGLLVTIDVSSDGRRLATGGLDGQVRLWSLPARTAVVLPLPKVDYYSSLSFSPGGEQLVIGASDRVLRVWNIAAGKLVLEKRLPDEPISVAYGPGEVVAAGLDPGTILILGAHDGRVIQTLVGHTQQVTALAFHDEATLVSVSTDGTIRSWNLTTGKGVVLGRHGAQIWGLALDREHRLVATSGSDRTIRITRLDGDGVTVLRGHLDDVSGVAFLASGRLASTSLDKTLRVWSFEESAMVPLDLASFQQWIARTTTAVLAGTADEVVSPR